MSGSGSGLMLLTFWRRGGGESASESSGLSRWTLVEKRIRGVESDRPLRVTAWLLCPTDHYDMAIWIPAIHADVDFDQQRISKLS